MICQAMNKTVIIITGPTASKTSMAIDLAKNTIQKLYLQIRASVLKK